MERSKSSILEDLWKHLDEKNGAAITADVQDFFTHLESEQEVIIPEGLARRVAELMVNPLLAEFSLGSGYANILENVKSILRLLEVSDDPELGKKASEDLRGGRIALMEKILASFDTTKTRAQELEQAKEDVEEVYRTVGHLNRYTKDKNPKAALMFLNRLMDHRLDSQQRPAEVGPPDLKNSLEALKVVASELQQGFVETWLENNKGAMEEEDGVLYYTMETRSESVEKANRDTFYALDFFDVTVPVSVDKKELRAAAPLVIQAYCEDESSEKNSTKEGYSVAKAVSEIRNTNHNAAFGVLH
jgi:hypothetical protein